MSDLVRCCDKHEVAFFRGTCDICRLQTRAAREDELVTLLSDMYAFTKEFYGRKVDKLNKRAEAELARRVAKDEGETR